MVSVATKSSTFAVGFCFPIIGAALCLARFNLRRQSKGQFHLDDWLAATAWLLVTGACASLLAGIYEGAFFLSETADEAQIDRQAHAIAQITGAVVFLWFPANACIKASILFFYRRIFVGKTFRLINTTLIALTVVWFIYTFLSAILYCGTHVRANFEGPWEVCPAWGFKLQLATFVLDTLIDFGIILLPIPFVSTGRYVLDTAVDVDTQLVKLHLETRKKVLLFIVFCVGGFAFVAGLMNTIYQFLLLTDPTSPNGAAGTPPSPTTNGQLLLLNWPVIEIGVGLIACNLPSLSLVGSRILSEYIFRGWRSISGTVSRVLSPGHSRGSHHDQASAGPSHATAQAPSVRGLAKEDPDGSVRAKSQKTSISSKTEYEMEPVPHGKRLNSVEHV